MADEIRIYGDRPDQDVAQALARRRVNFWLARLNRGLRGEFELKPAIVIQESMSGSSSYGLRVWAVIVDGEAHGHIRLRRSGKTAYERWFTGHLGDEIPQLTDGHRAIAAELAALPADTVLREEGSGRVWRTGRGRRRRDGRWAEVPVIQAEGSWRVFELEVGVEPANDSALAELLAQVSLRPAPIP